MTSQLALFAAAGLDEQEEAAGRCDWSGSGGCREPATVVLDLGRCRGERLTSRYREQHYAAALEAARNLAAYVGETDEQGRPL